MRMLDRNLVGRTHPADIALIEEILLPELIATTTGSHFNELAYLLGP